MWFTGKQEESEFGVSYFGARWYDPYSGRFMGIDPVEFSNIFNLNRYAYANNNPYKFIDPNGLWSAKAHDKILSYALSNKISNEELKTIQQSSRAFDKKTQAAEQSHMHSMARVGQSAADAIALRK